MSGEDQAPPQLEHFLGRVSVSQSLDTLTLFGEGQSSTIASKLAGQYASVLEEAVGKQWKNPSAFLGLHQLEMVPP